MWLLTVHGFAYVAESSRPAVRDFGFLDIGRVLFQEFAHHLFSLIPLLSVRRVLVRCWVLNPVDD